MPKRTKKAPAKRKKATPKKSKKTVKKTVKKRKKAVKASPKKTVKKKPLKKKTDRKKPATKKKVVRRKPAAKKKAARKKTPVKTKKAASKPKKSTPKKTRKKPQASKKKTSATQTPAEAPIPVSPPRPKKATPIMGAVNLGKQLETAWHSNIRPYLAMQDVHPLILDAIAEELASVGWDPDRVGTMLVHMRIYLKPGDPDAGTKPATEYRETTVLSMLKFLRMLVSDDSPYVYLYTIDGVQFFWKRMGGIRQVPRDIKEEKKEKKREKLLRRRKRDRERQQRYRARIRAQNAVGPDGNDS